MFSKSTNLYKPFCMWWLNKSINTKHRWQSHCTRTTTKTSEDEWWSMTLGLATPHCLLNGRDQDKTDDEQLVNIFRSFISTRWGVWKNKTYITLNSQLTPACSRKCWPACPVSNNTVLSAIPCNHRMGVCMYNQTPAC